MFMNILCIISIIHITYLLYKKIVMIKLLKNLNSRLINQINTFEELSLQLHSIEKLSEELTEKDLQKLSKKDKEKLLQTFLLSYKNTLIFVDNFYNQMLFLLKGNIRLSETSIEECIKTTNTVLFMYKMMHKNYIKIVNKFNDRI